MSRRTRVRHVHTLPGAPAVAAAGLALVGLQQFVSSFGLDSAPLRAMDLVGVACVGGASRTLGRRYSTRGRIRHRYGLDGWATAEDMRDELGVAALRRKALETRPSLRALNPAELRQLPDDLFGFTLGRSVTGPATAETIHFGDKEVCMVVAPPQTGKTALLGNFVFRPGAVIVTSTKTDLYDYTAPVRARDGEVLVFNPEGLGGVPSTLRWSPVVGCENTSIAQERASYLVAGASDSSAKDAKFWEDQAVAVLRAYLMAAALSGRTMADVAEWCTHPYDVTPRSILAAFPQHAPQSWVDGLEQILGAETPANTRGSIYVTLRLAVAFMGNPAVARACLPEPGESSFDVAQFIKGRNTLYLIGAEDKHSPIASLFAAFTGHIFEQCKRLAGDVPEQRHDPPVTFVLDEAALICPVPLAQWTSDAGGRGITIIFAIQSPSQLRRWGKDASDTIRNNAVVKVIFGGLTLPDDLESLTSIAGQRTEDSINEHLKDGRRTPSSVSPREVRTITNDRLRMLPRWHVLVIYRSTRPVIARITPVWERKDVKTATAGRKAA